MNVIESRLQAILESPNRDELIKGLIQDLMAYVHMDRKIEEVLSTTVPDADKIDSIKRITMFSDEE
jgi:hypothetical protein